MIHLDANFLIRALIPGTLEDRQIEQWIVSGQALGISAVAWSEFLCGPATSIELEDARFLFGEAVPFLSVDAELSARLFNATGRKPRSLADCQISAVAIRLDAILATGNLADFRPFTSFGLKIWTENLEI